MVTLTKINLSNNVNDYDSNTNKSKKKKLEVSLNTDSYGEVYEDDDSGSFMEKAYDEPIFKIAELVNGRIKVYFVSGNVFRFSLRKSSKAEVSLLCKDWKFCPIPNTIDKSILKEDLEKFGRNSRLSGTIAMIKQHLTIILLNLSPILIYPEMMLQ